MGEARFISEIGDRGDLASVFLRFAALTLNDFTVLINRRAACVLMVCVVFIHSRNNTQNGIVDQRCKRLTVSPGETGSVPYS